MIEVSSALNNPAYCPLVSIIIAVYNAEKYLEASIQSVLSQTYTNVELILIDGGSTDGSVAIIERYSSVVAYWISERDVGIYDAWNKGLAIAKGEWIAFVGSDDLLYPDAIENYVNHIRSQANRDELEFVSSQIELVTESLALIRLVGAKWEWEKFRVGMITWHVGCFHSRRLFNKYGMFDSSYEVSGDYELLLRPQNNLVTSFLPLVSARMRTGGVSARRLGKAIDETYKAKVSNTNFPLWKANVLRVVDKIRIRFKI